MFGFGEKKENAVKPVVASDKVRVEAGLPVDSDAPWVKARLHQDDRFLRMAAHTANWRRFAFGCLCIAVLMGLGLTYIAVQWRVTPVFIEVDKLGRTRTMITGVADGAQVAKKDLIHREMKDFIENVRSVTSDYAQNNKALNRAFSRLMGAAHTYVKTDLQSHKPNDVAEKKTVVVEVKLAMPITDGNQRNSWQVEWIETSYSLKGEQIGLPELWKANIQYELHPGKTEEEVDRNPVGFYIPTMSWAKQS